MRYLIIGIVVVILSNQSFGQDCDLISGTKNKKTGIESKGGVISSENYYSLLITRQFDPSNPKDSLNYWIALTAASKVLLTDSLLQTKGIFELLLTDGRIITWDNVTCSNNPLGFRYAIGFDVRITERQIREILDNPITKIKVFGILETEFSPKTQKEQQEIVDCLINKWK